MRERLRPWTRRLRTRLRAGMRLGDHGVALISVVVILAVMATAAADFAFNSEVDLVSAANARDDLRAHYLARSAINLSKLLLRVQEKFIEPNRQFLGGMDLQIADYAPFLMQAFNSKEGAEALGSMFGVDSAGIKGIGVDTGSFDLEMQSLDGKLNLNCGGGINTGSPVVTRFAASLAAMMLPARYNRMFEEPDEDGNYADRLEVMRAILDWADQDTVMFGSSAAEDYRYNTGKDPYEIKNHFYDTLEEVREVKGIDDDFMAAFGDQLTVYGDCKVNVSLAEPPLIAALIVQFAASPNDPALQWQNLSLLTRYVVHIRDLQMGFSDAKAFIAAVEEPAVQAAKASALDMLLGTTSSAARQTLPPVTGVKLNAAALQEAISASGTRRIWKLTASADVGRIKKKIHAVWDTKFISTQATKHQAGAGGFLYWREE